MYRHRVILFLFGLIFFSCTSQKKLIYFQGALPALSADSAYVLKIFPGDVLSISVFTINAEAFPFLSMQNEKIDTRMPYEKGYVVGQSGEVVLPLIGTVVLKGLTLAEATNTVKQKYKDFIDDPIITIKKLNFKVTVLGEVNSPGVYNIMDERATLPEVLGMAGDLTQFGNRQKLRIIRNEGGQRTDFYVDLTDAKSLSASAYYMHPEDIIYVEPVKRKAFQNSSPTVTLFTSLITSTIVLLTFIAVTSE